MNQYLMEKKERREQKESRMMTTNTTSQEKERPGTYNITNKQPWSTMTIKEASVVEKAVLTACI